MVRKISFSAILLFFYVIPTIVSAGPGLMMKKKVHDFGDLVEGESVNTVFVLTNDGDQPLLINDIVAPCGCTIPEFTDEPILPGKTGEVKVTFKSEGKSGVQRKAIKIISNMETDVVFQITANVLPK